MPVRYQENLQREQYRLWQENPGSEAPNGANLHDDFPSGDRRGEKGHKIQNAQKSKSPLVVCRVEMKSSFGDRTKKLQALSFLWAKFDCLWYEWKPQVEFLIYPTQSPWGRVPFQRGHGSRSSSGPAYCLGPIPMVRCKLWRRQGSQALDWYIAF